MITTVDRVYSPAQASQIAFPLLHQETVFSIQVAVFAVRRSLSLLAIEIYLSLVKQVLFPSYSTTPYSTLSNRVLLDMCSSGNLAQSSHKTGWPTTAAYTHLRSVATQEKRFATDAA